MGRAAHFRTRGVKTDAKPTLGLPKGRPGALRFVRSTGFAVTAVVAGLGMTNLLRVSRTSLDGEVAGELGCAHWLLADY